MNILFLEDEPAIQEVLTEYMKLQGYDVTCVQDGDRADRKSTRLNSSHRG